MKHLFRNMNGCFFTPVRHILTNVENVGVLTSRRSTRRLRVFLHGDASLMKPSNTSKMLFDVLAAAARRFGLYICLLTEIERDH